MLDENLAYWGAFYFKKAKQMYWQFIKIVYNINTKHTFAVLKIKDRKEKE